MAMIEMKVRPPVRPGLVLQLSTAVQSRMVSEWQLTLVGKFNDEWVPQAETTKDHLAHAWQLAGRMNTILYSNNIFVFKLDNADDFNRVLAGGPYSVEDSLLMLQPLPRLVRPELVRFNRVAVWVTLTGPPVELHDEEFAVSAGHHAGKVVDFKVAVGGGRRSVRVKVEIEAEEPLLPGFHVDVGNGASSLWVGFRYEGLPRLCGNCMRIGHLDTNCRKTAFQAKMELIKRMEAVAKRLKAPMVAGDDRSIEESFLNGSSSRSPPQRRTISCPTDHPTVRVFKRCKRAAQQAADPPALALTVVTPPADPVFGSNQEAGMFGDFGPGSDGTFVDLDASGSENEGSKAPKRNPKK